ncbi:hypothetical protein [Hymenobacter properus]|uniref:Uncharacterized protein n=1 Tax=Hymenobacter properus TaxID=2791026 RepID=A0A931BEV9_9BACT|nr:hypothetical protein [Hymenobacter properus]MBF9141261.1 hypothetical protein [Hymenobacter properus]MBR7720071.1 hypothetical protein [Microvirga sp. SRT04]
MKPFLLAGLVLATVAARAQPQSPAQGVEREANVQFSCDLLLPDTVVFFTKKVPVPALIASRPYLFQATTTRGEERELYHNSLVQLSRVNTSFAVRRVAGPGHGPDSVTFSVRGVLRVRRLGSDGRAEAVLADLLVEMTDRRPQQLVEVPEVGTIAVRAIISP